MITQERFTALYNEASEIFDPKVRQLHEIGHYIHCKLNTTYCSA